MDCCVDTPNGPLAFELQYKKVKNLNLRVRRDGSVAVSAPRRVGRAEVERFVRQRADWIARARARQAQRPPAAPLPVPLDADACMAVFAPFLERYYPLFAPAIGGKPTVRLKTLRSMWGCCRPAKREITLNRLLALAPQDAVEYVILHEYLHFWHPDHGPAFHQALDRLMPDNRQRRALLRGLLR